MPDFIRKFSAKEEVKIWVGTDSHSRNGNVVFATAIVIYKIGSGGTYFYYLTKENKKYDMYTRLIKETELSLETAKYIEEELKLKKPEIHLDIGLNGKSKEIFNSLTGYVKGLGYDCKTKPYSFAATNIAHLYTK
ncbi:MAG TPA: ribonuclease H-like YkuK family protein [Defluviitoga sp.]|nr:ribonuclease H-like YkuK family protein [Defluviitoga sp.]HOP24336.1 ribonuclease H-like YkuK family protein [Defluviitoga sp.]HPZ28674.1 ribonuclease H-like YkuK family protein [Defluviitoga sp.]HQD62535.1 ribonuclease H-like YkuK family protein [Defluviitoga sp.]